MDRLAEARGGVSPWPRLDRLGIVGLAVAQGCPARRVDTYQELTAVFDEVLPNLAHREEPLLVDVGVAPEATLAP